MHSPHMVLPIKPKQEPGFAPVSPSGIGGQHSRLVPTPPRPMSTHTPGMMSAGPSHSQQHTPPGPGNLQYTLMSFRLLGSYL